MNNLERAPFSENDDGSVAEVTSTNIDSMESLTELPSFEEKMAEKQNQKKMLFEKTGAIKDQADRKLAMAVLGMFFAKDSSYKGSQNAVAVIMSNYDEEESGLVDYLKSENEKNEHSDNPNEVMSQALSDLMLGDMVQREVEADEVKDSDHVESAKLRVLAKNTLDAQGGKQNEKNAEEMKIIDELYNYGQKPKRIEDYAMRMIQRAASGSISKDEKFSEKVMTCGKIANGKNRIDKAYATYKKGLERGEELVVESSAI